MQDFSRMRLAVPLIFVAYGLVLALAPIGWEARFLAIYWGSAVLFSIAAIAFRLQWIRIVTITVAAVFFLIGVVDIFFRVTGSHSMDAFSRNYTADYARPDGPLGKGPSGPGAYPSSFVSDEDGEIIYDVVYTIGEHGFRTVNGGGDTADSYLFFGGSFTYGEGVSDAESYPARFSEALDHRFTIANISFHGYGAHQMLRALETGLTDEMTTGKVRRAYYAVVRDHLLRSAGFYSWNKDQPRYVLDGDGIPQFRGYLREDPIVSLSAALHEGGGVSDKIAWTIKHRLFPSKDDRRRLFGALVERSAALIAEKHGAELVVLLWDRHKLNSIEAELKKRGIKTLRVSRIVGDLNDPALRYTEGNDNHPKPVAHQRLGEGLARMEMAGEGG